MLLLNATHVLAIRWSRLSPYVTRYSFLSACTTPSDPLLFDSLFLSVICLFHWWQAYAVSPQSLTANWRRFLLNSMQLFCALFHLAHLLATLFILAQLIIIIICLSNTLLTESTVSHRHSVPLSTLPATSSFFLTTQHAASHPYL